MPKTQWRTFSIRVDSATRKAVGVQFQCRWPLSEEEWQALFLGLEELRDQKPSTEIQPVSVSVRSLERLQAGQVAE